MEAYFFGPQQQQQQQPPTPTHTQQQQQLIRKKQPMQQQQQQQQMAMKHQKPIQEYYTSHDVTIVPQHVIKFAQPMTTQYGFVPYQKTHYAVVEEDVISDSSGDKPKFLLQLSQLPCDCGVNTLRQFFSAIVTLQSVHLIYDDKTAVLRFETKQSLDRAIEFAKQFKWSSKIITNSPYLRNYDQQNVWQYQESNKWKAHHEEMGMMIDQIPPRTDLIIEHGSRKYFIEKYNRQQGRQTNLRTRNQRMIRRIRIHVWAPKTNPIRQKAVQNIHPTQCMEAYFFGQQQQQQQ
eukprot:506446_1